MTQAKKNQKSKDSLKLDMTFEQALKKTLNTPLPPHELDQKVKKKKNK